MDKTKELEDMNEAMYTFLKSLGIDETDIIVNIVNGDKRTTDLEIDKIRAKIIKHYRKNPTITIKQEVK